MVTTYKPKKPPKVKPVSETILVILKKDVPISEQIKDAAEAIKLACPDIFKIEPPYPTVRMAKKTLEEVVYEIYGGTSKAKTGPVYRI